MNIIDFISQPWHWSVGGVAIALIMLTLILLGQKFGISTSFKAMCAIGGAGKRFEFFKYNWKEHDWLLTFVLGIIIGGYIAINVFPSSAPVQISEATVNDLTALGVQIPQSTSEGMGYIPRDLFSFSNLGSLQGILLMVVGGFLVGFGTRYANGCTSGHAITGLSKLQLPSLVAVIGFFIGGLISTFLLLPIILSL